MGGPRSASQPPKPRPAGNALSVARPQSKGSKANPKVVNSLNAFATPEFSRPTASRSKLSQPSNRKSIFATPDFARTGKASSPDASDVDGEEITGGRKIMDRIEGYIAKYIPRGPSRGGALDRDQRVLVRSALDTNRGSFYVRYPEGQKFVLYYPTPDENRTNSWTTFPKNPVGDKIKITVTNPHNSKPDATIIMSGGADKTYSFEFRIARSESSAADLSKYSPTLTRPTPFTKTLKKSLNPASARGPVLPRSDAAPEGAHPFGLRGGKRTRKNGRKLSFKKKRKHCKSR